MRISILLAFAAGVALAALAPRSAEAAPTTCSSTTPLYTVCKVNGKLYTSCGGGNFIEGRVTDRFSVDARCSTSGAPLGKNTSKGKQQEQPPTADE
jgi:hypothetical protein